MILASYPKYIRKPVTRLLFQIAREGSTGSRVAAAYELPLAYFPGIGPGSFPPHGFPRFLGFDSKTVQLNSSTRDVGTFYRMSFLTQLHVTERIPIQRSSNEHYKHNEKEKTKRKLKQFQDKGYSTKGAQISSA